MHPELVAGRGDLACGLAELEGFGVPRHPDGFVGKKLARSLFKEIRQARTLAITKCQDRSQPS
jgi:hypothetical protein